MLGVQRSWSSGEDRKGHSLQFSVTIARTEGSRAAWGLWQQLTLGLGSLARLGERLELVSS